MDVLFRCVAVARDCRLSLFALAFGAALVLTPAAFAQCPGSGSCTAPNGTPGCDDAACCNTVCALDDFCCNVEWDSICADLAFDNCEGLGGDCRPSCGKENIECLAGVEPEIYANRRPVARMLLNGGDWCTAWIVAAPNIMMTNQHCIPGNINSLTVMFDDECLQCDGEGGSKPVSVYSVTQLIYENASLDYALIRVNGDPASIFGVATVDDSDPVVGQQIYEIHHGEGRPKGYDAGQITSVDVPGACITSTQAEIGVNAIATGGASGSPIFSAENHCVVGICHCGPPCQPGWGVPMNFIWPEALPIIEAAQGVIAGCGVQPPTCDADIASSKGSGSDGVVDTFDLLALLEQWGTSGSADIANSGGAGGDGIVDTFDLLAMLEQWGPCNAK